MLSIDGLITGIDTQTVIDGLLKIQTDRIDQFKLRQSEVVRQQTSFSGVEAGMLGLRSSLGRLSNFANSALRSKTAVTSDESVATAAASDQAASGVYTLRVQNLATAHQLATQSVSSLDAEITQGTLSIQVGTGTAATVTIDSTNNSLQGLVDTINASGAGATASIITDAANGVTSYRLLLTADQSGSQNTIQLTNNLAASASGAVRPEFDSDNPVQAAADAKLSLGSGQGAIEVYSPDNQVDDLIPGVTLNLQSADPNKDITLNISEDIESGRTVIEEFVTAYNELMTFINEQAAFNPETGEASPLLGDRSVISMQTQIQFSVTSAIAKLNPNANRLSSIGITVAGNGQLIINSAKLDNALAGRLPGVSSTDVIRLFSLSGESDRSGVRFVVGGRRTTEGTVDVEVTSPAERATLTGTTPLASSIEITSANKELVIGVDGLDSSTLTLTEGTYTQEELAAHLQTVINSDETLRAHTVTVAVDNGSLAITSQAYGSASEVEVISGAALTDLGFLAGASDKGQDVVGKFIVDGQEEEATGRGQLLIGKSDNDRTADLQIRVSLTSSQLDGSGPEATIDVTRGLASRLDVMLGELLDPVSGRVKTVQDRFDDTIGDIEESIERLNARFTAAEESLIKQFAALESAVSEIQTTGNFLATQLASTSGLASLGR